MYTTTAGQSLLEQANLSGKPFTTALRPGESYTTTLVFDLPAGIRNPTLLMNEGEWVRHLIIVTKIVPCIRRRDFNFESKYSEMNLRRYF